MCLTEEWSIPVETCGVSPKWALVMGYHSRIPHSFFLWCDWVNDSYSALHQFLMQELETMSRRMCGIWSVLLLMIMAWYISWLALCHIHVTSSANLSIQNPQYSFLISLHRFLRTNPNLEEGHFKKSSVDYSRAFASASDVEKLDRSRRRARDQISLTAAVESSPLNVYVHEMPAKFTTDLLWLFENSLANTANLTSNGSPVRRLIEQVILSFLWVLPKHKINVSCLLFVSNFQKQSALYPMQAKICPQLGPQLVRIDLDFLWEVATISCRTEVGHWCHCELAAFCRLLAVFRLDGTCEWASNKICATSDGSSSSWCVLHPLLLHHPFLSFQQTPK